MDEIRVYNQSQLAVNKDICEKLQSIISDKLPESQSKLWHGHPVWFINENPIVGYAVRKNWVTLLFWSGQSFDESGLLPEGNFKAAEAHYTSVEQINHQVIVGWLGKARDIQWDYKNIVKRKGKLERLD